MKLKSWPLWTLWALSHLICVTVQANNAPDTIPMALDESLQHVVIRLLHDSANKTRVKQLDHHIAINTYPSETLSNIYQNFTLEQISALETELSTHSHYIYRPIKEKVGEVKQNFLLSCQSYYKERDLKQLEQNVVSCGKQVVSLQKLVLRIINSKLEGKTVEKTNTRTGRKLFSNIFEDLSKLFFGISMPQYLSSSYAPVNQMYSLMKQLEKIENAPSRLGDQTTNNNVDNLKRLLKRLRNIYRLNQIASHPNQYLNTPNISPYNYDATLKLVGLLGEQRVADPSFNPLFGQFRFWMNLFTMGNVFNSLSNPIQQNRNSVRYDPNKLRQLIKILEENEKKRQQEIEQNQIKNMLQTLLQNQNRQQQQIESMLKTLANNTNTIPSSGGSWVPPTANNRPIIPSGSNSALIKLKDQRRLLNELLQELQKPLPLGPTSPSFPVLPNLGTGSQEIAQAQQALLGIMKNITPLINNVMSSGLVSRSKIDKSKVELLSILNAVNSRELDEEQEANKEMTRLQTWCNRLHSVLNEIIDDADQTVSTQTN